MILLPGTSSSTRTMRSPNIRDARKEYTLKSSNEERSRNREHREDRFSSNGPANWSANRNSVTSNSNTYNSRLGRPDKRPAMQDRKSSNPSFYKDWNTHASRSDGRTGVHKAHSARNSRQNSTLDTRY